MNEECEKLYKQLKEGMEMLERVEKPIKMAVAVNRRGLKLLKKNFGKYTSKVTFNGMPVYLISDLPFMNDYIIAEEGLIKEMARQSVLYRKHRFIRKIQQWFTCKPRYDKSRRFVVTQDDLDSMEYFWKEQPKKIVATPQGEKRK